MKNSENHNLDELLKDKLTNGSAVVPDFVWDNIEAELFPKKKRRGFFWWFFGGFGLLALFAVYFLLTGHNSSGTFQFRKNETKTVRSFQPNKKQETANLSQVALSSDQDQPKVFHKCFAEHSNPTSTIGSASAFSGEGKSTPSLFERRHSAETETNPSFPNDKKDHLRNSITLITSDQKEPMTISLENDLPKTDTENITSDRITEIIDSLAPKKAGLESVFYTPLAYNELSFSEPNRSFFSLNFYGGPSLYNIAVLKDYFISGQLSERTFSSAGFEAGFNAMFHFTPKFGLYAGIGFNRKQTMFNYNLAVTEEDYFKLVDEETPVPYANIADDGVNSCFIAKGVQAEYNIQSVLLSIGGTYEVFRMKKFFVGADLKFTANLQSSMNLERVEVLAIAQPSKEKFSYYQPGIGLSLNYQLTKRTSVGISPMFSKQFGQKEHSFYKNLDELIIPVSFRISF